MNPYALALFTHFLGLVGLFVGYGLEWAASSLLRRSTTADAARSWLRIYKLSLPISGPGLLILIISGGYMASLTGSMKQGWISASLLAIVFALGIGFVFILPRIKRIRAALPEGTVTLARCDPCASAGPDDRYADSSAFHSRARHRLSHDREDRIAFHFTLHSARRHRRWLALRRNCVDQPAHSESLNYQKKEAEKIPPLLVHRFSRCELSLAGLRQVEQQHFGIFHSGKLQRFLFRDLRAIARFQFLAIQFHATARNLNVRVAIRLDLMFHRFARDQEPSRTVRCPDGF